MPQRAGPRRLEHRCRRHQLANGVQVVGSADGTGIGVGGTDERRHQAGLDGGFDEAQVLPLATAVRRDEG